DVRLKPDPTYERNALPPRGNEADDRAFVPVGHDVQGAVWSRLDVANARVQLDQQPLFGDDPIVAEDEPREMLTGQRRDAEIASPPGAARKSRPPPAERRGPR